MWDLRKFDVNPLTDKIEKICKQRSSCDIQNGGKQIAKENGGDINCDEFVWILGFDKNLEFT